MKMKRLVFVCALVAICCVGSVTSLTSLITPATIGTRTSSKESLALGLVRSGGASSSSSSSSNDDGDDDGDGDGHAGDNETADFRPQASALFGNIRIPAALFAGASAGAAFAMPVAMVGSEGLKLGLVKRLYALLLLTSLSSEIVAVVVSTLSVGALAARETPPTTSVNVLLRNHYDLEWTSVRLHFLSGVLCFILGVGLRAWVQIGCPVIAKATLGIIMSAATLCVAFIQEVENDSFLDGIVVLPYRYLQKLVKRASSKPLFAAALALSLTTWGYILWKIPHVVSWLSNN